MNAQVRLIAAAVIGVALLIVAMNTFYVVDQRKQAVVLRFGEGIIRSVGFGLTKSESCHRTPATLWEACR